MRVLHVGKYFPPAAGGMERFLCDLAVEQRKQGIDAQAIVHHHVAGRPTVCETVRDVPICRVRTFGNFLYAPISPTFRAHLKRQVRRFRPDILHFHVPNTAALLALASKTTSRIPWIATWQSDVVSQTDGRLTLAYRFYRPLEQRFLAKCRFVLTSSPAYLRGSLALKPWSEKCDAVPLGISGDIPAISQEAMQWAEAQWQPDRLRAICIGRLTFYKGHSYLVDAVAKITGVQLRVVGSGQLAEALAHTIAHLQVGDRIRLMGFVEDERVEALLATADCLVLPSIERTEAFGLVLLEAMRHGKPVIATDIPNSGPAWIVQQGPSGLVVPPRDAQAMAHALAQFRDNPILRRELGEQGDAVFRRQFQIDRVAAAIQPFYDRASVGAQPEAAVEQQEAVCK